MSFRPLIFCCAPRRRNDGMCSIRVKSVHPQRRATTPASKVAKGKMTKAQPRATAHNREQR